MISNTPIGADQIANAMLTLHRYQTAKAPLQQRLVENEKWYRLRHWQTLRRQERQVEPVSGWLFNAIANKHASAMDNIPTPTVLPREQGDRGLARTLSAILPVILEQNDFEQVYSYVWDSKLRGGTGIYGVFWDPERRNGLGDVSIQKIDPLNLYWESGVSDIQQSKNIFHVELQDNDALTARYPGLKLTGDRPAGFFSYDDTVDTTGKSAVVDWYYKKSVGGRTVLHYCKFVGDTVLFSTENEPTFRDRGWYDHGLYPFLTDPLFRCEGTPWGFGYIDLGKSAQEYIDRGNQAVLMNLLSNARPRYFLRADGAVNREEYADLSRDFVTTDGNLGADSIRPIEGKPLNDIYLAVLRDKVDELKEVTGNRDVSTGGATGGVTAASAIAAMQEAGSRLDRDANKASYRVFRRLVKMVISLVRQFYTAPRAFRILGQDGEAFLHFGGPAHFGMSVGKGLDLSSYRNGVQPDSARWGQDPTLQEAGAEVGGAGHFGMSVGKGLDLSSYRNGVQPDSARWGQDPTLQEAGAEFVEFFPEGDVEFDISVTAQKASPYSRMSQNELALQFFGAGFFRPELASQALMCLDMMDFDRKDFVIHAIRKNAAAALAVPGPVERPKPSPMEKARQHLADSSI